MPQHRPQRLAADIHKVVARYLHTDLQRPELTVSEVEVTSDLRAATVWISVLTDGDQQSYAPIIERESGRIRTQVAQTMRLQKAPTITLKLDTRAQRAQRVQQQLRDYRS